MTTYPVFDFTHEAIGEAATSDYALALVRRALGCHADEMGATVELTERHGVTGWFLTR